MGGILTNVAGAVRAVWLAVVALFVLWPGNAGAQSDALLEQYNQVQALYQQGKYAEAIPFAQRALELGEEEFGPDAPTTGTLLDSLVGLYWKQGRNGEAEPLYKRSPAISGQCPG